MKNDASNVPIIIPCYYRPEFLSKCLDHLKECNGISNFTVHFSFDSKGHKSKEGKTVLDLCHAWDSCPKVIHENTKVGPQGSFNSTGAPGFVTQKISHNGGFIYIEEDTIVTKCFLDFCLHAINEYEDNPFVSSVSGHYDQKTCPNETKIANINRGMMHAMICGGVASWTNRWSWIHTNLARFCQTPYFLSDTIRKNAKISLKVPSIRGEFQGKKFPVLVPNNVHGAGLVFLYNVIHGRYTLYPDLPLGTHIGWYGWHISRKREDSTEESPLAYSRFFDPDISYGQLPLINKEFLANSMQIDISVMSDPDPL